MIIRQLRNNEQYKRDMLFAAAFNMKTDIEQSAKEEMKLEDEVFIGAFSDDGETLMAQVAVITYKTMYYGKELTAAGIAGVSTLPEYRRMGCVREIFKYIFDPAREHGWDTSFLYPFSYRYYRKYGYERVLQHKTLKIPFSAISQIPRNDKGVLYKDSSMLPELLGLYNKFASRYNVMFFRKNSKYFSDKPFKTGKYTYIWYEGTKASAYFTGSIQGRTLNISELVWLDKESLTGLLGFIRMYEGQLDDIYFETLDFDNPLDLITDSDRSSSFGMYDGAMGRVIDIKKCLELYPFPKNSGELTIEVTCDFIKENNGFYKISFGNGNTVVSFEKKAAPDITVPITTLSKILFGDIRPVSFDYLPEMVVHCNKKQIEEIFKPHPVNLFERF